MADARKTLNEFYAAWGKGDADALDQLLVDEYVDHDPTPGFSPDKEGAKRFLSAMMNASKDVDMKVLDVIVDGDQAAAHWVMEWTQVGDFMGMLPADGKRLRLRGHDFYRMKDGLIAEIWHCEDLFGVMGQLGVLPQPG